MLYCQATGSVGGEPLSFKLRSGNVKLPKLAQDKVLIDKGVKCLSADIDASVVPQFEITVARQSPGNSLEACRELLLKAGARYVQCATIGKT